MSFTSPDYSQFTLYQGRESNADALSALATPYPTPESVGNAGQTPQPFAAPIPAAFEASVASTSSLGLDFGKQSFMEDVTSERSAFGSMSGFDADAWERELEALIQG